VVLSIGDEEPVVRPDREHGIASAVHMELGDPPGAAAVEDAHAADITFEHQRTTCAEAVRIV
jgi:hypothetical protein